VREKNTELQAADTGKHFLEKRLAGFESATFYKLASGANGIDLSTRRRPRHSRSLTSLKFDACRHVYFGLQKCVLLVCKIVKARKMKNWGLWSESGSVVAAVHWGRTD